ncbi:hypothetical protein GCM10023340_03400 [Nocardioides marinquilinus]|uniref:Uncharacterized protein n=1 Tax=Nocardioides marinquilinus TaxID=1210400 RepID=A0ABP9PB80_9ACTN
MKPTTPRLVRGAGRRPPGTRPTDQPSEGSDPPPNPGADDPDDVPPDNPSG